LPDDFFGITNFNIERNDLLHKRGSGIIVYIQNNITYRGRYDLESEDIEWICLEIKYIYNCIHVQAPKFDTVLD